MRRTDFIGTIVDTAKTMTKLNLEYSHFRKKKLTILFSIVRALRRAGSFDFLTDAEFDKIIAA
jgi:hypothetical protein